MSDLLRINGYDRGAGEYNEAALRMYVASLQKELGINAGDSVYEVGCGAGALLYVLYESGMWVTGIDYSDTSIEVAKFMMPDMTFHVAKAEHLPSPEKQFDAVLSFSTFHYFPDLEYAARAISEMYRIVKPDKVVMILDVPDAATKEASEAYRRDALPPGEYERLYSDLPHLYYDREWFLDITGQFSTHVEVSDQHFPGYGNAAYRFNVCIHKV